MLDSFFFFFFLPSRASIHLHSRERRENEIFENDFRQPYVLSLINFPFRVFIILRAYVAANNRYHRDKSWLQKKEEKKNKNKIK